MKREVVSLKFPVEGEKAVDDDFLDFASLVKTTTRGKAESADGAACSATRGEHVLAGGVYFCIRKLVNIQIGGVLCVGRVAAVTSGNDGVEQLREQFVRLFVASDDAARFDHWVA